MPVRALIEIPETEELFAFTGGFPTLSEIVTVTLRNRSAALANSLTKNNALLHRLNQKEYLTYAA